MALANPEPDDERRSIARELLKRDAVVTVDLFLSQITGDWWYREFRRHAGPKVLAQIRKRFPKSTGQSFGADAEAWRKWNAVR